MVPSNAAMCPGSLRCARSPSTGIGRGQVRAEADLLSQAPTHVATVHGMTSQPNMSLDAQLCYALYAASRAMTSCYRPVLEPIGLTYPQYLVMLVLWEEEVVSVGHLGQRLQLESGTLSPLLKRLESAGLIIRRRRLDDERSVQVDLTVAGRALREQALSVPPRVIEATGTPLSELLDLRDLLHVLTARLRAAELHASGPSG